MILSEANRTYVRTSTSDTPVSKSSLLFSFRSFSHLPLASSAPDHFSRIHRDPSDPTPVFFRGVQVSGQSVKRVVPVSTPVDSSDPFFQLKFDPTVYAKYLTRVTTPDIMLHNLRMLCAKYFHVPNTAQLTEEQWDEFFAYPEQCDFFQKVLKDFRDTLSGHLPGERIKNQISKLKEMVDAVQAQISPDPNEASGDYCTEVDIDADDAQARCNVRSVQRNIISVSMEPLIQQSPGASLALSPQGLIEFEAQRSPPVDGDMHFDYAQLVSVQPEDVPFVFKAPTFLPIGTLSLGTYRVVRTEADTGRVVTTCDKTVKRKRGAYIEPFDDGRSFLIRGRKIHPYAVYVQEQTMLQAEQKRFKHSAQDTGAPSEPPPPPLSKTEFFDQRLRLSRDSVRKYLKKIASFGSVWEFGEHFNLTDHRSVVVLTDLYMTHLCSTRRFTSASPKERDVQYMRFLTHNGHAKSKEAQVRQVFIRYCSILGFEEAKYLIHLYTQEGKDAHQSDRFKDFYLFKQVDDELALVPAAHPEKKPFYVELLWSTAAFVTAPLTSFIQEKYAKLEARFINHVQTRAQPVIDDVVRKASDQASEHVRVAAGQAATTFAERLTTSVLDPLRELWNNVKKSCSSFIHDMVKPLNLPEWLAVGFEMGLLAFLFVTLLRMYFGTVTWGQVSALMVALVPIPVCMFLGRVYEHFTQEDVQRQGGSPTLGDFFSSVYSSFSPSLMKGGWAEAIPRFKRVVDAIEWFGARLWKFAIWGYTAITGVPVPTSPTEKLVCDLDVMFRPYYLEYQESRDWFTVFRDDPTILLKVTVCQSQLEGIRPQVFFPRNGVSPPLLRIFQFLDKEITEAATKAHAFARTVGERTCPVWLNLWGPAGDGKSYFVPSISRKIGQYMFQKGRPEYEAFQRFNDVFFLPQGEGFFDGYNQQRIGAIDDIFQGKGVLLRQPLALWLMVLISSCPCPLLTATPEKKGLPCKMDFLITTSNAQSFTDLGLERPQALHDRITFNARLVWCDESGFPADKPHGTRSVLPQGWSRKFHLDNPVIMEGKEETNLVTEDELVYLVVNTFLVQDAERKAKVTPTYVPPEWAFFYEFARGQTDYAPRGQKRPEEEPERSADVKKPRTHADGVPKSKMEDVGEENKAEDPVSPGKQPVVFSIYRGERVPEQDFTYAEVVDALLNATSAEEIKRWQRILEEVQRGPYRQAREDRGPAHAKKLFMESQVYWPTLTGHSTFAWADFAALHPCLLHHSTAKELEHERRRLGLMYHPDKQPGIELSPASDELHKSRCEIYLSPTFNLWKDRLEVWLEDLETCGDWSSASCLMPFVRQGLFTTHHIDRNGRFAPDLGDGSVKGYEVFIEHFKANNPVWTRSPPLTYDQYLRGMIVTGVLSLVKCLLIGSVIVTIAVVIVRSLVAVLGHLVPRFAEVELQSGAPSAGKGFKASSSASHAPKKAGNLRKLAGAAQKQAGGQQQEEQVHQQSVDAVAQKVLSNLRYINANGRQCWLLGLYGRTAIATTHSFTHMLPDMKIQFNADSLGSFQEFLWSDVELFCQSDEITDADAGEFFYMQFPPQLQSFCDITGFFSDMLPGSTQVTRYRPVVVESAKPTVGMYITSSDSWCSLPQPILGCDIEIRSMPNQVGYCGLPYFAVVQGSTVILGLHGAGDGHQVSYAHRVTKSEINQIRQVSGTPSKQCSSMAQRFDGSIPAFPVPSRAPQPLVRGTSPLGVLPQKLAVWPYRQTRFVQTQLHPERPPLEDAQGPIRLDHVPARAPARHEPCASNSFAPERMPMAKYSVVGGQPNVTPPFPESLFKAPPFEHLLPPDFRPPNRILTIEEAIFGCEGFESMDMTKSSGYPYACMGIKRVHAILDGAGKIRPTFRKEVEDLREQLKTQIVPCVVLDCLKDELLPLADVSAGKVRLFCAAELKFNVLAQMYLGPWAKSMSTYPWKTPISIGLDPHSMWSQLTDRLLAAGRQTMWGDFRGQEFTIPTIFRKLYTEFVDFSDPWTDPVESRIRANLLLSLLQVIHLFRMWLYWSQKGQGSGTGPTAWFASFSTWLFHLGAWRHLGLTDQDFVRLLQMSFMGDDSIVTVLRTPQYNMLYLAEFAPLIGMSYQSSTKGEVTSMYSDLYECQYLKRGFVRKGRLVLAPLSLVSLLEIPMWEKVDSSDEDRRNAWANMMLDLVHHPREVYEMAWKCGLRYSARTGLRLILPSYDCSMQRLERMNNM